MYLWILLFIVIVFYKKKDGFKNAFAKIKKVDTEKERLMKEAEKRYKTQKDKITNEERQGILTSYI